MVIATLTTNLQPQPYRRAVHQVQCIGEHCQVVVPPHIFHFEPTIYPERRSAQSKSLENSGQN